MRAFGAGAEPIVDDLPALEFELAGLSNDSGVTLDQLDRAMRETPWISNADYQQIPEVYRVDATITRLSEVSARPVGLTRVDDARALLEVPETDANYLQGAIGDARGNLRVALGDDRGHWKAALRSDSRRSRQRT